MKNTIRNLLRCEFPFGKTASGRVRYGTGERYETKGIL